MLSTTEAQAGFLAARGLVVARLAALPAAVDFPVELDFGMSEGSAITRRLPSFLASAGGSLSLPVEPGPVESPHTGPWLPR